MYITPEFSKIDMKNAKGLGIFSGSFNPIHMGHISIINAAEKILGFPIVLELSSRNADKGEYDIVEINRRLKGLEKYPCIVTKAPTFIQKAVLFSKEYPNKELIFVVGADTWVRIWDAKYAGPLDKVAEVFRENNVKFLVFGRRQVIDIDFGYEIGEEFRIQSGEASQFNNPISSTELRIALTKPQIPVTVKS